MNIPTRVPCDITCFRGRVGVVCDVLVLKVLETTTYISKPSSPPSSKLLPSKQQPTCMAYFRRTSSFSVHSCHSFCASRARSWQRHPHDRPPCARLMLPLLSPPWLYGGGHTQHNKPDARTSWQNTPYEQAGTSRGLKFQLPLV